MGEKRSAILIAGPTASGKSALALEKAQALGGTIVNADSMQVYDVLNLLTARPQADELALAPHRLYGFVPPSERFSTGAWLNAVREVIADTKTDGAPLIFVGGTGLYFEALLNGVAVVPPVAPQFVESAEAELEGLDRAARAALLKSKDPDMFARLKEPDRQRVARVLSVLYATGKSLAHWQDNGQSGVLDDFEIERVVVNPDRDLLRARIAARFEYMMDHGAVEEVSALMSLELDSSLPVMKAIGVREIYAWQARDMTRAEAIERSVIATAQYAKRQRTWLRNRMGDWPRAK